MLPVDPRKHKSDPKIVELAEKANPVKSTGAFNVAQGNATPLPPLKQQLLQRVMSSNPLFKPVKVSQKLPGRERAVKSNAEITKDRGQVESKTLGIRVFNHYLCLII
jgi:hypothetical protein